MGFFETTVSNYKSCNVGRSQYVTITTANESRLFNEKATKHHQSDLKEMCNFVSYFVDNGTESDAAIRLVLQLLELINLDDAFNGKQLYVCADGKPRSKSEVLELANIEVQPFLLGILHFISQHCKDNKVGEATYKEYWRDGDFGKEFVGSFGSEYAYKGTIEMYSPEKIKPEQNEPEELEAGVVEEDKEPESEISTSFTKNGITFQVNMIQSGNNNTQVAYAENVYSSWNKKDTEE